MSERQTKVLQYIIEYGELTIKNFEDLYPNVTRRTLQRELKDLIDLKLLEAIGATNLLTYKLVTS